MEENNSVKPLRKRSVRVTVLGKETRMNKKQLIAVFIIALFVGLFVVVRLVNLSSHGFQQRETLSYTQFYNYLKNNKQNPVIYSVKKIGNKIEGRFYPVEENKWFQVYVPQEDKELIELIKNNVEKFEVELPRTFWPGLFYFFAPILLFLFPIFIIGLVLIYVLREKGEKGLERREKYTRMAKRLIILIGVMNIVTGVLGILFFIMRVPVMWLASPLLLIVGIGLVKFKEWARISEIILTILGVLFSIILYWYFAIQEGVSTGEIWLSFMIKHIFRFLIAGLIIYFFTHPKVKEQFEQ